MCGGAVWGEEQWRPSGALVHDLDPASFPMRREIEALSFLPGVPLS
jgi:hypothetical protein